MRLPECELITSVFDQECQLSIAAVKFIYLAWPLYPPGSNIRDNKEHTNQPRDRHYKGTETLQNTL